MRLLCQYSLQVLHRVYRESFAPFACSSFVVYPVIACRAYPGGNHHARRHLEHGLRTNGVSVPQEPRRSVDLPARGALPRRGARSGGPRREDTGGSARPFGDRLRARSQCSGGTAILVHGLESHGAPTAAISAHTYAATVEVSTPAGPLTALSAHVYPGEEQHADLKRLVEVLGTTFAGRTLLIGGDFNAARRFDEVYGGKRHGTFFAAMKTAGLHEVHWELHGREIQSFWGRQSKEAYQDDHFFVTTGWASRVRSCKVIDNEVVRRLSDHGPVEMELDVTAANPPDDTSRLR
jgi:endonuclease/exonuclease/phosphatase family metal-dependent hydrolase